MPCTRQYLAEGGQPSEETQALWRRMRWSAPAPEAASLGAGAQRGPASSPDVFLTAPPTDLAQGTAREQAPGTGGDGGPVMRSHIALGAPTHGDSSQPQHVATVHAPPMPGAGPSTARSLRVDIEAEGAPSEEWDLEAHVRPPPTAGHRGAELESPPLRPTPATTMLPTAVLEAGAGAGGGSALPPLALVIAQGASWLIEREDLLVSALQAMEGAVLCSERAQAEAGPRGVLELVLQSMRRHRRSAAAGVAGSRLLWRLCSHSAFARGVALRSGALACVARVAAAHPFDLAVRNASSEALRALLPSEFVEMTRQVRGRAGAAVVRRVASLTLAAHGRVQEPEPRVIAWLEQALDDADPANAGGPAEGRVKGEQLAVLASAAAARPSAEHAAPGARSSVPHSHAAAASPPAPPSHTHTHSADGHRRRVARGGARSRRAPRSCDAQARRGAQGPATGVPGRGSGCHAVRVRRSACTERGNGWGWGA